MLGREQVARACFETLLNCSVLMQGGQGFPGRPFFVCFNSLVDPLPQWTLMSQWFRFCNFVRGQEGIQKRSLSFFYLFPDNPTDISSEHSLRTCTQVQRNVRKSDVVYACRNKEKRDQSHRVVTSIWLYAVEPSSPGGHPWLGVCSRVS